MNERDKKLKRELDRRIDVYDTPEEEVPPKSKKTAAPKAKSRLNPKLVKDAAQREEDRNLQKELQARAKSVSESDTELRQKLQKAFA